MGHDLERRMAEEGRTPLNFHDLSRCSWCGRTGTLTSLSVGNRCELQDECDQARRELQARTVAVGGATDE